MADKSERGRGSIHIKEIIPDVVRDIQARVAVHREAERLKHLKHQGVPKPKTENSSPN